MDDANGAPVEGRFVDPAQALRAVGIHAGTVVADIGTGTGAYALPLARLLGDNGRVYAIDIQQDLLTKLANEAKRQGLDTIEVIWGDADRAGGTKLADNSVDMVLLSNTLFQLEAKDVALTEARRILKPEGQLVIIDWSESFNGLGPHKDDVVTSEQARKLAEGAGFTFSKEFAAGAHHYGLLYTNTNNA